ncbi:MAG TPA: hypothetical protein PKL57_15760, partial [Candidatus Wallbacteria bacterium]|nr:hypothetical protein [Candidatus Wallbacteria bacterium]
MKMETGIEQNFEEIYYYEFIKFVSDKLLNKLDGGVFTFLKDCGYIDAINLQGFRFNRETGETKIIDQTQSDFVSSLIQKISQAEACVPKAPAAVSGSCEMHKFDFENSACVALPLYRLDEAAVYEKKLSLSDNKIFGDKNNHYKAGYLYFLLHDGEGRENYNYVSFLTAFLRSVMSVFDELITSA